MTEQTSSSMLPVLAIVGRPNVGKSTLFNVLTKTRDALVVDRPGVTRDRHYGQAKFNDKRFVVVDTGGIGDEETAIDELMAEQSWQAIREADAILFLVDARAGLTGPDEQIANQLRKLEKPIHLVVNKVDGLDENVVASDFYRMGLGEPHFIAASHGRGIHDLLSDVTKTFPLYEPTAMEEGGINIAIVGRPNVGKSTLVNRMLGEERVIVFDQPGTTRDSIFIPFTRHHQRYTLIDTAGVRRRARIDDTVEKFSVVKTLQAIEASNVVIFVMNAQETISDQDTKLLGLVLQTGKALIIAVNKWDGLDTEQKDWIKRELERRLVFVDFARIHFISALHGTGVGDLYEFVKEAYRSAHCELSTSQATQLLEKAVAKHQPPLAKGRRIKLRYAHIGGHNPPRLIIHGKQTDQLPNAYVRYLESFFRKRLKLKGTPIQIVLKNDDNPFLDKDK